MAGVSPHRQNDYSTAREKKHEQLLTKVPGLAENFRPVFVQFLQSVVELELRAVQRCEIVHGSLRPADELEGAVLRQAAVSTTLLPGERPLSRK